ncbi:Rcs stress response system protein RcsF [Corallincola platygyrae]|uniref:Rcs stress response system protein RcsF n=1 Tax=Corallincola platygyrae TaxID=1193278 RepID=A0ABW4XRP2_9GAMM
MRVLLVSVMAVIGLTGCAENYTFSTNLDQENFQEYYRASSVKVYQQSDLASLKYDKLGPVQGESCRNKADLPPAQASDARTQARRSTAEMGGNGVVFSNCVTLIEDDALPGCIDSVICTGIALRVDSESEE